MHILCFLTSAATKASARCVPAVLSSPHVRVQVSGNHRLEDNKAEQKRLTELGRELSSSAVEGRPVGPLRVWPGGLAMSRTLGDAEVSRTAPPEPAPLQLQRQKPRLLGGSDSPPPSVQPLALCRWLRGHA